MIDHTLALESNRMEKSNSGYQFLLKKKFKNMLKTVFKRSNFKKCSQISLQPNV